MKAGFSQEEQEVIGAARHLPEISIILPFEPVMSSKSELRHRLNIAVEKVRSQLAANYPPEKAMAVIARLGNLVNNLNFNTHKKGLALFVSPTIGSHFGR